MFTLQFSVKFEKSFSTIRDAKVQNQIWRKVQALKTRAPLGKKLKGNPYWSLHIGQFRVIYELRGTDIFLADILERKFDYRELR